MRQHATLDLAPAPRAPRTARAFVAEALEAWDLRAEDVEAVQLVVSELVTNALLHAPESPTVALELVIADDCVRVLVSDGERGEPEWKRRSDPRAGIETGRGVWIIDAFTDRWGTEANERGGKTVWCELRTEPENKR